MNVLQAQKNGTIKSNLKGVALGDAWISPLDSVLTWAPYLLSWVNIRLFIAIVALVRDRNVYRQNKYILQQIKMEKKNPTMIS